VWIYHHGYSPDVIDHINGDTFDNKIENLRECSKSQNQQNRKIDTNNLSGVKGVGWCKKKNKWRARIIVDGKEHHIGFFDDLQDAKKVMNLKRIELHGIFARNN
jgi:hypothetical protein